MAARIRAHDWAATPLGALADWPAVLRTATATMLDHPLPMSLSWGADLLTLYNDAYEPLLRGRSDELGRRYSAAWFDGSDAIAAQVDRAWTGQAGVCQGVPLRALPGGATADACFDLAFSPLRGDDGAIMGVLGTAFETTAFVMAARERNMTLAALRDSEARLEAVFAALSVGVHVADENGRTILTNAELTRFLPSGVIPSRDANRRWRWRAWDADGTPIAPSDFPGARALRGDTVVPGIEMLYTDDTGREVWTVVSATPIRDAQGAVIGQVGVVSDIDALKRSVEALRVGEERLRQFGDASHDILWMRDPATLQWQYLTPAFERIYGLTREEAVSGDNYRSWLDLIVPEDRARASDAIRRVAAGEHRTFDYRIRRPSDGQIRWLRDTDFPILDPTGRVVMIGGIGQDVTADRLAEERVTQSEERLRSAVEVGQLGLWDWNVATGELHWSDEHFRMEGYRVDEVTPSYETWEARLHPDDRARTVAALRDAMDRHEEYGCEFRVVHPDGAVRWLAGRGRFFYDEDGQPLRMIGAMTDMTDRRESEERQKVLVAELQHRTLNLMGVVRSMAEKTARQSADLVDFRARFRDRLEALSRVQSLLSRLREHDRVTFDELIRTELSAMDGSADRVTLDGPDGVRLRSSTVQTLAMAIHELATNAMKYGALGQAAGRLAISWSLDPRERDGRRWLDIDWRETGVAMPAAGAAPLGTGQGRELIERALPYQLGAVTSYTLGHDGVHCTISIPVSITPQATSDHG
ncbi:PAS domain-containing sensor histidine kinase [Sphingomonas adhaesiva]|uniref:PAS domain-containing sensor histidine kinase n=1 Tax=Sphingomonas adhaesiva TaxID=28212 RepID=UPI002FF665D7